MCWAAVFVRMQCVTAPKYWLLLDSIRSDTLIVAFELFQINMVCYLYMDRPGLHRQRLTSILCVIGLLFVLLQNSDSVVAARSQARRIQSKNSFTTCIRTVNGHVALVMSM